MPSPIVLPLAALTCAVLVRFISFFVPARSRWAAKWRTVVTAVWFVVLPIGLALPLALPYTSGEGRRCPPPITNGGWHDDVLRGRVIEDTCRRSAQWIVWVDGGLLFAVLLTDGIIWFSGSSPAEEEDDPTAMLN